MSAMISSKQTLGDAVTGAAVKGSHNAVNLKLSNPVLSLIVGADKSDSRVIDKNPVSYHR